MACVRCAGGRSMSGACVCASTSCELPRRLGFSALSPCRWGKHTHLKSVWGVGVLVPAGGGDGTEWHTHHRRTRLLVIVSYLTVGGVRAK